MHIPGRSRPNSATLRLLGWNVALGALIFALLEWWRPCYFLTDDNLSSGFPTLIGMGRRMLAGHSPFICDYLYGGHYDLRQDMGALSWHPFYLLPALLAETRARFWIIEMIAGEQLLLGLVGFTLLAQRLRDEFNPGLPDWHLVFYTLSFTFCTYILQIGPSWVNFLGNASVLPWLTLGLLEPRLLIGMSLVGLATFQEVLTGFLPLIFSTALCQGLLGAGLAYYRRSPVPLLAWLGGNLLGLLMVSPELFPALVGFAHTARAAGMSMKDSNANALRPVVIPYSLLIGNWTELLTKWAGDPELYSLNFPFLRSVLPCAAAWCIFPVALGWRRWRFVELLFLGLLAFLLLLIVRPVWVGAIMHQLPLVRSMRWPFREALLLLFFLHLLFIVRTPTPVRGLQPAAMLVGTALFLLPLPFIRVPSLNRLALDRAALFSGGAERFWDAVKTRLAPGDEIVTVIPQRVWFPDWKDIPYSYAGTGNFPVLFRVTTASGYTGAVPVESMPIKMAPFYWFGAFNEEQVPALRAEHPHLVFIRVDGTKPLRLSMEKDGKKTDLTPLLPGGGKLIP